MGTDVIHAGLHSLVLSTRKLSLDQARGHCDYIMRAIREVPCMKYLELDPLHYWQRLILLDQYNFAGLEIVQQELESTASQKVQDQFGPVDTPLAPELSGMAVRMQWDIAEHLPRKWKQLFLELLTEFLCKPLIFRKKQLNQHGSEVEPPNGEDEDQRSSSQVLVKTGIFKYRAGI